MYVNVWFMCCMGCVGGVVWFLCVCVVHVPMFCACVLVKT